MLAMVKDTPSIPLDRLSGSKTQMMTDLSKLVENSGSALLMPMPCSWCAEVALCTFLFLESLQMRILRGIQLSTSQDPMNGIHQSWIFLTHLVIGSNDPPERFAFDHNFMNTPIGQSRLSISWMTHPNK